MADATDRIACRDLIRAGSKTFSAAALLLPAGLREAAYALYGFCRLSDDLVDVEGGASDAIQRLRERLELAYAGTPADGPVDRAFADVVAAYDMPRALPEALIDGLEWDVTGVACETLSDLYAYAARVAGSVGAMMSVLTNIARDVGEDARAGRLYLPRAWLRAEGIEPDAWLVRPRFGPAIGNTVERLLQAADALYQRADAGISRLPPSCRPGIFAARHLYRAIGVEVARRGFDSLSDRARVPAGRKLRLVGHALLDAAWARSGYTPEPALPETAYLVDAVAAGYPRATERPKGGVSDRVVWVARLFAELEARDRVSGERA